MTNEVLTISELLEINDVSPKFEPVFYKKDGEVILERIEQLENKVAFLKGLVDGMMLKIYSGNL